MHAINLDASRAIVLVYTNQDHCEHDGKRIFNAILSDHVKN